MESGKTNPRDLKMKLAFEITKMNHGEEKAKEAQDYFVKTIQKKEIPDEVSEINIEGESIQASELLVNAGLANSKSDARRKMKQNGVYLENKNGLEIMITDRILNKDDNGKIIKVGKHKFVKIKFE